MAQLVYFASEIETLPARLQRNKFRQTEGLFFNSSLSLFAFISISSYSG
jgi:hypothetical protein